MTETTELRLRWGVVVGSTLPPVLLACVTWALVLDPPWLGPAVYVVVGLTLAGRARGRSLVLSASGLTVRRDRYALQADWEDVVGVERRRRQGLRVEELVLRRSELCMRAPGPRTSRLVGRIRRSGADLRVQISLYDKNWRAGAVGDDLRARSVLLGPVETSDR